MLPKPGRNDPASHLAWKKGFLLKSHLSLWFTFQTNAAKNTTQKILGTFDKLIVLFFDYDFDYDSVAWEN